MFNIIPPRNHTLNIRQPEISTPQTAAASVSGPGVRIVAAALARIDSGGADYAFRNAPTSPYADLSGNLRPDESRLNWLKNQNKCNQFVGDVLTAAGLRMPTVRQADGSEHFALAEDLPGHTDFFARISNRQEIRPGDLIVLDRHSRHGANGAHVEIITAVSAAGEILETAGARRAGAGFFRDELPLTGAVFDARMQNWRKPGTAIYILRSTP